MRKRFKVGEKQNAFPLRLDEQGASLEEVCPRAGIPMETCCLAQEVTRV